MTRYRLDPVFDRTLDGAVKGIIRYDIYLDGHFVGSRRRHALCHEYLDELMPSTPEPAALRRLSLSCAAALIRERPDRDAGRT
jgi:hypothetical protein